MAKNRNLQENSTQNFILKGFNSVQIGGYILLGSYLINSSLQDFIADDNPMGMMSIQIIETICFFIIFLVFAFSTLAIFFSSRRTARKENIKIWNKVSKQHFLNFLMIVLPGIFFLSLIKNLGINYLTPFFLLYLGFVLAILNSKKKKQYYLLAAISVLLAVIVYIIPTYWYSSLLIIGGSFFVYGIIVRK
tara:strand:+ start:1647 stop:2219 length:573 start_codon:yes stop_codon:yes gene_type:complete